MNFEGEFYMIYDKYGGFTHNFSNPLTSNIDMEYLLKKPTSEYTQYLSGIEAYTEYNNINNNNNLCLPNDLNFDIINIYLFDFLNADNCRIIITIVGIYIDKIVEYYNLHNDIPNKEFIIQLCRYHISYTNTFSECKNNNHIIINNIIKSVIIPKEDIMDPIIQHPTFINNNIKLYDYQRRSIQWMLDTELKRTEIYYGNSFKYEITIGSIVINTLTQTVKYINDRHSVIFKGGALIDEVGLGKTIQSITLCLLNPAPVCDMTYVDIEHNMLKSRATLIICPNHLCGQWLREFKKMINNPNCHIIKLLTKNHFTELSYLDLLDADFVIVSFNFIGNSNFTQKYTSYISKSKSYYKSKDWNNTTVQNLFNRLSNELVGNPRKLFENEPLFPLIYWHRIMIDEFHEVYTVPKYEYIKNIILLLKGTYKWVITGTPFDNNIICFNEMLNFSIDYNHNMGDNIIQIPNIESHMLNNYFRRNTKSSIETEIKLPDLREKIIWLKFSHTERMMYNAYLSDVNINKRSVIIRQICCHPKLADEIKGVLSECKTLEDIENTMVEHYRSQYEASLISIGRQERRIAKTDRNILITNYKIQKRILKEQGITAKIVLPPFEHNDIKNSDSDNDDNMVLCISDEDDTKTVQILINEENQTMIKNKIGEQLNKNVSLTLNRYNTLRNKQNEKLEKLISISNGKKSSYNFFCNMLERIKKCTNKSKQKLEEKLTRARNKDNGDILSGESSEDLSEDSSVSEDSDNEDEICCICLDEISGDDIGVTKCGHLFDYECLRIHINNNDKCPICKTKNTIADISLISYEKPSYTQDNIELLQNKMALINKVGTKLTNLIYYLNTIDEHVIIFSQWDLLLKKVGCVLSEHGIANVFCRGNVWIRDKAIRDFNDNDNIKVIMLSSESAASGTNLTKAKKVILLDPISGTYDYRRNMEWQAVGRAYRMGQNSSVEIVRFIIRDTVEEEIYRENKIEDAKQHTQLNISETTDETITLNDDKLKSITIAVRRAKETKEKKLSEKKITRQRKLQKISTKTKVVKKRN